MIEHVVDVEGPVLDSVVARRIARAHGWQRTGARIQERVNQIARTVSDAVEEDVGTFYSSRGKSQAEIPFRVARDEMSRTVGEISLRELISLARAVRESALPGESALAGMARELGLSQVRTATRIRLERAIHEAGRSES